MNPDTIMDAMNLISDELIETANARRQGGAAGRNSRKAIRIIVIAAILTALSIITALAVNFGWHQKLIDYFSPTPEQMDALEPAMDMPDISVTDNGSTLSVKQTIADRTGVYVLAEFTAPENVVLSEELRWQSYIVNAQMDYAGGDIQAASFGAEILDVNGNQMTILAHYLPTQPVAKGNMFMLYRNLGYYTENGFETVLEGEWLLEWELSYEDSYKNIMPNEVISGNGVDGIITEIYISPLSVSIYVNGGPQGNPLSGAVVTIHFADGSQLEFDAWNNSIYFGAINLEGRDEYIDTLHHRFESIIDIDAVESVAIRGVTIPVE